MENNRNAHQQVTGHGFGTSVEWKYLAMKWRQLLVKAIACKNFRMTRLSERRHKNTYWMIPFLLNSRTCRLTCSDRSRSGVAWGQGGWEGSVRGTRKPWGSWICSPSWLGWYVGQKYFSLYTVNLCNLLHINYTSIKLLNKFHCLFQIPCCLSQGFCLHAKETTVPEFIQTIARPLWFPKMC